jgi:hypothetical protein
MLCFVLLLPILCFVFYSAWLNYRVIHTYKVKVATCFVLKENLIRKLLVGTLKIFFHTLAFSLLLVWTLLEIYADFGLGNFLFYFLNAVSTIYIYHLLRKRYQDEIPAEVFNYLAINWLPFLVALVTSFPYSVYLINTITLSGFLPEIYLTDYVEKLLNSKLVVDCPLFGIPIAFVKIGNYVINSLVLVLAEHKRLFLFALFVLFIKGGLIVWVINRTFLAFWINLKNQTEKI